ncbi:MAG: ABC transporter substrate-binding protein [Desulfobulbaceae bacterium]|nr:ABC transporter substrate-binding protein [Desulfobulbaceae bacterium]
MIHMQRFFIALLAITFTFGPLSATDAAVITDKNGNVTVYKKSFKSAKVTFATKESMITDKDGRVTHYHQPFTRIISLYTAHTDNLFALGLDKEIIAVSRSDKSITDRPKISYKDDPERLLALKPDLVLIRPMISRGYPKLIKTLIENGVQVVSLQPNAVAEMFDYWAQLGDLTNRQKQAAAMIDQFRNELDTVRVQVERIPKKDRKNVYFEAMHRKMKTFSPESMAIFVLQSAGGINVAADARQVRKSNIAEYGKEHILSKANEIDVFLAQKGRMNSISVDDIKKEAGFQVIKAVKMNQVYLVEEAIVSRPTIKLVDGIKTIFTILYPERAAMAFADVE